jgi:hypothetical protein
MKITQITINDILGVRQFDAHLVRPVNYIMGKNGAGKSSVREAVKMAFLGSPDRVALKKEYGEILHGDAKAGLVSVETEEHGAPGFTLPKGNHTAADGLDADALPYCIDPALFASLKADDKRSFLMKLTGTRPDREKIAARMLDLGVSQDVIDLVVPMLRQGFPAAAAQAEQQRKEARALWKATTCETYGEVKAAAWKAVAPQYDAGSIAEIATAIDTQSQLLEGMICKLGGLRQEKSQAVMVGNTRQRWEADAGKLESAKRKLATDIQNRDVAQAQFEAAAAKAGTGKREGLVHDLARALYDLLVNDYRTVNPGDDASIDAANLALNEYEDRFGGLSVGEGDPEAAAKLPELEKAAKLMQRAVENAERDLKTAQTAADALQREGASAMRKVSTIDKEIADLEETIAKEKQFIADYQVRLQAEQEKKRRAQEADQITTKAADYHRQAMAWDKAYAALSPDGIPAELLAAALDPFNAQLKFIAETIGWPVVALDADMQISLGGRQYRLLSESEQWRTDTVLAIAISHTAGIDFVVLDRFDVLDNTGRAQIIDGLDVLAEQQIIESALVMGTVKNKPDLAAFDQSAVFWIEAGEIVVEKSDMRKAA